MYFYSSSMNSDVNLKVQCPPVGFDVFIALL
jgi:hypothetical protein